MATSDPELDATRPRVSPATLQRWLVALAAAFCAVAVAFNIWAWYGPPSWRPRIGCPAVEFNFGERRASDSIHHDFVLKNTGQKELVITDVLMDCTCLSSEVRQCRIPPWQSFALPVRIGLEHQRNGPLRRSIVVESNDPVTPRLVMILKGRVVGQLRSNPVASPRRVRPRTASASR